MAVARACLAKVAMDVDESLQHLAYGFVDGSDEVVPLWIMIGHGF